MAFISFVLAFTITKVLLFSSIFVDIVFIRTWFTIEVPKFYNPVTSLLLPKDEKNSWRGMKTVGQLKREREIQHKDISDHLYTVSWHKKHSGYTLPSIVPESGETKFFKNHGCSNQQMKL